MKLPRAQHLSAEQLAGQLLMPAVNIGFMNRNSPQARRLLQMIRKYQIGGVILFGGQPVDVQYWVQRLQAAAEFPLLVAADLERGVGGLFREGTTLPHALAWGAAGDLSVAAIAAGVIGQEAKALGINIVFAPVLDLANEPDNPIVNIRSFHPESEKAATLGRAFIKTLQNMGIACVAKHFPGHGRASADSHLQLPQIPAAFCDLISEDLFPFCEAIGNGVKGIMSAHICLNDSPHPVTFRRDLLRDYLRKELKFKGIIFSDALNMKAVSGRYSAAEQVRLGTEAGLDIFLMPENVPLFHRLITEAANSNPEIRKSIQEAVDRIFSLKKWIHRSTPAALHAGQVYKFIGSPQNYGIALGLAEKSITCVHQSNNFPLQLPGMNKCLHIIFTDFESKDAPLSNLQSELDGFFEYSRVLWFPGSNEISQIKSDDCDLVVFSLYSRTFGGHVSHFDWTEINRTLFRLTKTGWPVVILVFGNPFYVDKLRHWEKCAAVFLAYSYVEVSQKAAFKALLTFIDVGGSLPVRLSHGKKEFESFKIGQNDYRLRIPEEPAASLPKAEKIVENAIKEKTFPGGVLLIAHKNRVVFRKAFGNFEYEENSQKTTVETIYDLASLTKVLATAPAILKLADEGALGLEQTLADFYPDLSGDFLMDVTITALLAHQSGLPAWVPFYEKYRNKEAIIRAILKTDAAYTPGSKTLYSDLGSMLLGDIIERVSGLSLDEFCRDNVFRALGLHNLHFRQVQERRDQKSTFKGKTQSPPTGFDEFRQRIIREEVNDANCFVMGGVAGHAGLFGNALDAAAMAQLFLNKGIYNSRRFLKQSICENAVQRFDDNPDSRGLGWDKPGKESSAGKYLSADSFGHLAFTGPSIWADPQKSLVVVFLCNRTHPDPNKNLMGKFRPLLHDAIVEELVI